MVRTLLTNILTICWGLWCIRIHLSFHIAWCNNFHLHYPPSECHVQESKSNLFLDYISLAEWNCIPWRIIHNTLPKLILEHSSIFTSSLQIIFTLSRSSFRAFPANFSGLWDTLVSAFSRKKNIIYIIHLFESSSEFYNSNLRTTKKWSNYPASLSACWQ